MSDERNEMVTKKGDVWVMDADTFVPTPDGYLMVGGVEYPIFSFLDIPIKASLRFADLGTGPDGETYEQQMDRNVEQIMMLNAPGEPRLARESFDGVSPRQILTLTVLAASIARVPLKAAAEEESGSPAASPSPSPASADSTGGVSGIS